MKFTKKLAGKMGCGALLLAMGVGLCACGQKSPEEIMTSALTKMSDVTSMSYDMTMNMEMTVSGEAYNVMTNAQADCIMSPMQMQVDMAMDMGEMGSLDMRMYAAPSGDGYMMYTGMDVSQFVEPEEGGDSFMWVRQAMPDLAELEQYDAKASMDLYISSAGSFVENGTEEINGAETVRYDGVISGEAMNAVVESTGVLDQFSGMGFEDAAVADALSSFSDLPVSIWVDGDEMPVRYEMDMTAMMQDMMAKLLESMADGEDLQLEIGRVVTSMTLRNFNGVSEIVIPEDALNAELVE